MRRRRLLAALAAGGLSGCTSLLGRRSTPTLTPVSVPADESVATREPTATPLPDRDPWYRRTSVVDLRTVPRTLAVHPRPLRLDSVRVDATFTATATPAHPARLLAAFTNATDRELAFEFGPTPPMSDYVGQADTGGNTLLLVPAPSHPAAGEPVGVERSSGCWRAVDPPGFATSAHTMVLDPGERLAGRYRVVGYSGDRDCLPPGFYRFASSYGWRPTVAVWETDRPGPTAASVLSRRVPAVGEPTAWFHEATPATPVYLVPSRERLSLPADAAVFTLVNRSRTVLAGARRWRLLKLHEGAWKPVTAGPIPAPEVAPWAPRGLPPGGSREWGLRLSRGDPGRGDSAVGFVGGGTYAVGVPTAGRTVAALLELDGPPVRLAPTDHVRGVSREGGVVSVLSSRYDTTVDRQTVLFVRRVDGAPDAPAVVAEQVMHTDGLRNTLSFLPVAGDARNDRATAVRLRTDRSTVGRVVGYGDGARRFRFRGRAYEAAATNAGGDV